MSRFVKLGFTLACFAMLAAGCGDKKSANPLGPTPAANTGNGGGGGGGGSVPTVQSIALGGANGGS